jgi:hypothetical protein
LTSEGVDVDALTRLMKEYESKEEDWGRYALGDASRGYTRNLVDVGNGKSNLVCYSVVFVLLVWRGREATNACWEIMKTR